MDTSSWLAALSGFTALLSALYARWTWGEARKANLLALHSNRIEVFRAFNSLRQAVQEQGLSIERQHVLRFLHPSHESKFYFAEAKTSELLVQYFDTCFALTEQANKFSRSFQVDADRQLLESEQDKLSEQEQSLFNEAKQQLEKELYHAVRRKWFHF